MIHDPLGRRMRVPSFKPEPDVGAADSIDKTDSSPAAKANVTLPTMNLTDGGIRPTSPLLPDLSMYDLTVLDALDVFPQERRRKPSDRTMQRYCHDGRFDCYKLKTTRNGTPVHEWIINSASLLKFIHSKPIEPEAEKPAPPTFSASAKNDNGVMEAPEYEPSVTAAPIASGGATDPLVSPRSIENPTSAVTSPNDNGAADLSRKGGVEVLIENAALTARVDALNDLVGELREDKKFMQEEIIHKRKNDALLSDTHKETLRTLKAVAVAGRHTKIEVPVAQNPLPAEEPFYHSDYGDNEEQNPPVGSV